MYPFYRYHYNCHLSEKMVVENGKIDQDADLFPQIGGDINEELNSIAAESGLAAPALHKLFRIFLVFSDADENSTSIEEGEEIEPESSSSNSKTKNGPAITVDEVLLLCGMAFESLDWSKPYSMEKLDECRSKLEQQLGNDQLVKFKEFLTLFPSLVSVSNQVYHDVVSSLYEQIVVQVIRKVLINCLAVFKRK